jgi:hypothetical protein
MKMNIVAGKGMAILQPLSGRYQALSVRGIISSYQIFTLTLSIMEDLTKWTPIGGYHPKEYGRPRAAVPREVQILLVGRCILLALDLRLGVIDGVRQLDFESMVLSSQRSAYHPNVPELHAGKDEAGWCGGMLSLS